MFSGSILGATMTSGARPISGYLPEGTAGGDHAAIHTTHRELTVHRQGCVASCWTTFSTNEGAICSTAEQRSWVHKRVAPDDLDVAESRSGVKPTVISSRQAPKRAL